jgi:hypothetical protein
MRFVFDVNLSPKLVKGFRGFGEDVQHISEFARSDIPDIEIFQLLKEQGGIFITNDYRITKEPQEAQALRNSGISVFFIDLTIHPDLWGWITFFVTRWEAFKSKATETKQPFAFRVTMRSFDEISSILKRH